jgi:hypothetical protein
MGKTSIPMLGLPDSFRVGTQEEVPAVGMTITVMGERSETTFANPLPTALNVVPAEWVAKRKVFG